VGMTTRQLVCVAAILGVGAFAAFPAAAGEQSQSAPAEVAKLERQALLGDAKAAFRLLQSTAAGKSGVNPEAALWLTIAAENGHPIAQYNLGAKLLGGADPRDRVRAEYWLSRAAKAGDESAAQLLKRVRKGQLAPRPGTK